MIEKLRCVIGDRRDAAPRQPTRCAVTRSVEQDHAHVVPVVGVLVRVARVARAGSALKPEVRTTVGRAVLMPCERAPVSERQAPFAHGASSEPDARGVNLHSPGARPRPADPGHGRRRIHGRAGVAARRAASLALSGAPSADLLRADALGRLGPRDRGLLRGVLPPGLRAELPPALRRTRAAGGAARGAGRRLRLGREHGERACSLAAARDRPRAARRLGPRRRARRCQRRRELLVRGVRHGLVRTATSRRSTTASRSCPEASARTTTARSSAAPSTGSSSTRASRPATRRTTAPRSTSSAPSCARWSRRGRMRAHTASNLAPRRRSTRVCCSRRRLKGSVSLSGTGRCRN